MKDIKEMTEGGYPTVDEIREMVKTPEQLENELYERLMESVFDNVTQSATKGLFLYQAQFNSDGKTKEPMDRVIKTLNELGFKTELAEPPKVDANADPNTLLMAAQHNNMYLFTVSWKREE